MRKGLINIDDLQQMQQLLLFFLIFFLKSKSRNSFTKIPLANYHKVPFCYCELFPTQQENCLKAMQTHATPGQRIFS